MTTEKELLEALDGHQNESTMRGAIVGGEVFINVEDLLITLSTVEVRVENRMTLGTSPPEARVYVTALQHFQRQLIDFRDDANGGEVEWVRRKQGRLSRWWRTLRSERRDLKR